MLMFGTGFGLICALIIIGWWMVQGGKSVGRKLSEVTAGPSGCAAYMSDDASCYIISYIGPNNHIEHEWVDFIHDNGFLNTVDSLQYEEKMFKAQIGRKDYNDEVSKKDVVEAPSLKELKGVIEKNFQEWNAEYRAELQEEWERKHPQ